MAKSRSKKAKGATLTVNIPEELRLNPKRHSCTFGVFGVGGPIPQKPIQKSGFPPGEERPDIPEATDAQYLKLIENGSKFGITASESKVESDSGEGDS